MWRLSACGVTPSELPIRALVHVDAYARDTPRTRVLLVAGLTGESNDVELTLGVLRRVASACEGRWERMALTAIPCANLDGLGLGPENDAGGGPSTGYPPEDGFFGDPTNPREPLPLVLDRFSSARPRGRAGVRRGHSVGGQRSGCGFSPNARRYSRGSAYVLPSRRRRTLRQPKHRALPGSDTTFGSAGGSAGAPGRQELALAAPSCPGVGRSLRSLSGTRRLHTGRRH